MSPLAAFLLRRVPPTRAAKRPIEEISREAMSNAEVEDFFENVEGFIPECSLTRETVILLTYRLVDEPIPAQGSSSSGRDAESSHFVDAPEVTIPMSEVGQASDTPVRNGEEGRTRL